jgi:flagellin-like hook-associated protein FlgL
MNTMNTYNRQLASNRRITKLSDDPVGVISTLDIRAKIRNIDNIREMLTIHRPG